jgi:diguanylate cyclase (GGDEF)-like protein
MSTARQHRLAQALLWAALAMAGLAAAQATPALPSAPEATAAHAQPGRPARPLADELDALVQRGQDDPQEALAQLAELSARTPPGRAQRPLALARGLVAATANLGSEMQAALVALAGLAPDPLAASDAALVRATAADARGDTTAALGAAHTALQGYTAACAARSDCDHRARWQTLVLMARQDLRRGLYSAALAHALAAHQLALGAGDVERQALALAVAADLAGLQGDTDDEDRHFAQAERLARAEGEPLLRSRLKINETRMQRRRGDAEGARRAARAGLALAHQGGSARLEAVHLANLSDALVALGQPRQALQAIEQALPTVRRHGDRRTERVLLHNAALAHIGLGQTAEARREMDAVLAGYRDGGATADQAVALREFGDAFAKLGDMRSALQLFHQERRLAAEIMAANRESALAELRKRFDHEAQERRLEQLGRERTLMTAQLDNRAALQQVWAAGAVVLTLAGVLVALMYRRVRRLKRRLEDNQALLRAQSHRDPLTGLHNRRGLQETLAARGLAQRFEGALMLLDIDHFKRINDGQGHAAGDAVLVEVARRLSEAVRGHDLVVRWGGEEFIVCMAGAGSDAAAAQALARRVLDTIGATPVPLPGGGALRVTVSVGYACFPLPPAALPLPLERAINLVDMALYTAKNQGRNRAIGITAASASQPAELLALETDFEQASREGRIQLLRLAGPETDTAESPATPLQV